MFWLIEVWFENIVLIVFDCDCVIGVIDFVFSEVVYSKMGEIYVFLVVYKG